MENEEGKEVKYNGGDDSTKALGSIEGSLGDPNEVKGGGCYPKQLEVVKRFVHVRESENGSARCGPWEQELSCEGQDAYQAEEGKEESARRDPAVLHLPLLPT